MRRRVRYQPQLEVTECGAACLAMVLDFHRCSTPLTDVRSACGVSRDGSSAAAIVSAARGYGLQAMGLRLEPRELHKLPLPAILHWEFNHFVVLERTGKRGVTLLDPARGRREVSWSSLDGSYTGIVLAFEPTPALPQRAKISGSLARYRTALASQRPALMHVGSAALMLELLGLVAPAATQIAIDHVIKPARESWLIPLALAVLLSLLTRRTLEWLRDHVIVGLQTALDLTIVSEFVQHLLALPLGFFQQRSTGDLMQRVHLNGELRAISAQIVMSALDALLLVGYASLMLAYDMSLGLLVLTVSLSRIVLYQLMRQSIRHGSANLMSFAGREHGALVESLAAPEMTRALNAEPMLSSRFTARMSERLNAEIGVKRSVDMMGSGMTLFDGCASALVLWLGGSRVLAGDMTLGVFAGFVTLQGLVDRPLAALFSCIDRYLYAQSILNRVDDVLQSAPARTGSRILPDLRGELTFREVGFRYGPTAPWLFETLSFVVRAGEKVAIVGRSGQGKSTLMKLLLGIHEPTRGQILIDGVPIEELNREALARQVGVVLQEPFLLDDTVEANLRLRMPEATLEELRDSAELACVDDVIEGLAQGYRTRLGSEGVKLSGGQQQRLAIARALVGRPKFLLLDEATSSLDLELEARVHERLGSLGCTRILIAHRLATVRDADCILVVEGGQIVQQGSYAQLVEQPGLFRELLEASA